MSKEKQIEEMAKIITKNSYLCKGDYIRTTGKHNRDHCEDCDLRKACLSYDSASELYNAGYRKQREARYCADPNYRTLGNCGECGGDVTCLNNYCPNCGAKMKGGE